MIWILLIVVLPIVWYVSVFNDIKRTNLKVEEAFANIDVALAKRYSVLTQLVEVVKGYAKHEKETLLSIVEIRRGMPIEMKEKAMTSVESDFSRINVLVEGYPDLKASEQFLGLQDAIRDTEEHLSAARRLYNSNVTHFNSRIETFPGNMVANQLNATKQPLLQFDKAAIQEVNLSI